MARLVAAPIVAALLALLLGESALAHGGAGWPDDPGMVVPPNMRAPEPGRRAGQGPRSAAPPPPGNSGASAPGPVVACRPVASSYDLWMFWWAYNREEFLALGARRRARESGVETEGGVLRVGEVHERSPEARRTPTDFAVETTVIPVLEEMLAPELHFDIRGAAVIALAKTASGRPDHERRVASRLLDILRSDPGRDHFIVRESAALGLGMLGCRDEEVIDLLCEKVRGTDAIRTRAFAGLALGLLRVEPYEPGYLRTVDTLRDAALGEDESQDDVPVCALFAMGLTGDAAFMPGLEAMLRTGEDRWGRRVNDLRLSHAASALGRLSEEAPEDTLPGAMDVLRFALLRGGKHTRRSAVLALGSLGRRAELSPTRRAEIVRLLDRVAREGSAEMARHVWLTLGRLAAALEESALREAVYRVLRRQCVAGSTVDRPWAALALGLMGRDCDHRDAIRETIRREFVRFRGPARERAGLAIALGLVEDRAAVPDLLRVLRDRGEEKALRGACAVALGLVGDRAGDDAILTALVSEKDRDLCQDAAVAAGLLGLHDAIPAMIGILGDRRSSLYVQGSTALALGRLGDRRAIEPLVAVARDAREQDLSRALAVVALGLLGDPRDVPALSRISRNVNYRANVSALEEVLSIL